ncbi:MAG: TorF family putative porin [Pseudomonadota bacterium]|nr:TorF family putative porin [Pseudomonadota bacterium]
MPAYGSDDSPHKVGKGIALPACFARISQTDNHLAIQGSLEYGYEPWGVYLGTWASSVNTMTSDGEIEIRWFGGLRGEFVTARIAWDLGAVYYYPGDDLEPEKDYVEPKLGLSHEFAGLPLMPRVSASVHYSPDFYLEAGKAVYADGAVGMSLPYGFALAFHVGCQTVDAVDLADLEVDVEIAGGI